MSKVYTNLQNALLSIELAERDEAREIISQCLDCSGIMSAAKEVAK